MKFQCSHCQQVFSADPPQTASSTPNATVCPACGSLATDLAIDANPRPASEPPPIPTTKWTVKQRVIAVLAVVVFLGGIQSLLNRGGISGWVLIALAICGWLFNRERNPLRQPGVKDGRKMYRYATKLERQFKWKEALEAYDLIVLQCADQPVAKDAQLSAEQIRRRLSG